MFRPRFIPVLLLQRGRLVKTRSFKDPQYIGDPINAVQIFNRFKSDEIIILDIEASRTGKSIKLELVKDIGDEAFMPFAVGGGIRTLEYAEELIRAGAEKVVLNSVVHENPGLITSIARQFGNQSVVVSMDVKKNLFGKESVWTESGTKNTGLSVIDFAKRAVDAGAGELMITSIPNEGGMSGVNLELTERVASAVEVPVIAHGGVGNLDHYVQGIKAGASAVAAGSFFVYSSRQKGILINYPEKNELMQLFE